MRGENQWRTLGPRRGYTTDKNPRDFGIPLFESDTMLNVNRTTVTIRFTRGVGFIDIEFMFYFGTVDVWSSLWIRN